MKIKLKLPTSTAKLALTKLVFLMYLLNTSMVILNL